jgi:hypothetical protein
MIQTCPFWGPNQWYPRRDLIARQLQDQERSKLDFFFCFSYTNSEFHTSPFRVKATSAFITLVPKINGIIYAMCTAIKSFQDTLLVLFINCLSLRVERVEPNSVYIATARSSDESTLAWLAELTSFIISMKSLSKIQYRISKLI